METFWQFIMDITGCHITPHGMYIPGNPYKFILWNELLLIIVSFAMTIVWLKNRALRRQLARERLRAYKHGYKPVNYMHDRIAHGHVPFETVKKIIGEYYLIWVKYIDFQGNVTERTIEFHELFQKDGHWYIGGFCLLRCEARSFRVDRIIEIKPVEDSPLYPIGGIYDPPLTPVGGMYE